jgi:glycerophosphoryl diester phosphodiesterase
MITILAHRGNVIGPRPDTENTVPALRMALAHGWGVETDIRRAPDGGFYISHGRRTTAGGAEAAEVFAVFRAHPRATIALNVKETGDEAALVAYLDEQGVLAQTFLFDMELVEPHAGETAALFRRLHGSVRLAARVSDRHEPLEPALAIESASIIWLDEFDGPWCTDADVRRLRNAGRVVYAVSPELHGGSLHKARARWMQFHDWGVDGICTDYPALLARTLAEAPDGVLA